MRVVVASLGSLGLARHNPATSLHRRGQGVGDALVEVHAAAGVERLGRRRRRAIPRVPHIQLFLRLLLEVLQPRSPRGGGEVYHIHVISF